MRRQAEAEAAEPSELLATAAASVETGTLVEAGAGSVATTRADPSLDEPASSELALEPASATVGAGALTEDGCSDTATDVASVAPAGV
jgi:hypothetical protein